MSSSTGIADDASLELVVATLRPTSKQQFTDDICRRMWLSNDWEGLLISAPHAIELLGLCGIVASSESAIITKLSAPATGWKYVRGWPYLHANLLELTDQGASSFLAARAAFSKIAVHSQYAYRHTVRAVQQLSAGSKGGDEWKMLLDKALKDIKREAENCTNEAREVSEKFLLWKEAVTEVNQAVNSQNSETISEIRIAKDKKQVLEELKADHDKRVADLTKDITDKKTEITAAQTALDEEEKKIPDGDKVASLAFKEMGINIGGQLANTLIKTIPSMIPATAGASAASGILGAAKESDSKGKGKGKKGKKGSDRDRKEVVDKALTAEAANRVDRDPLALKHTDTLVKAVESLNGIVNGSDGINWDLIPGAVAPKTAAVKRTRDSKPKENGADPKDSTSSSKKSKPQGAKNLTYVTLQLDRIERGLKSATEVEKKSKAGRKIISTTAKARQVEKGLKEYGEKSKAINKSEGPDKKIVKKWQKEISSALATCRELEVKGASTGVTKSYPTLRAPSKTEFEAVKGGSVAEQVVNTALARVRIKQEALRNVKAELQHLQDRSDVLSDRLADTRAEIKQLDLDKASLDEIRQVLEDTMCHMSGMMEHLENITEFFRQIYALMSKTTEESVGDLLDYFTMGSTTLQKQTPIHQTIRQNIFISVMECSARFQFYIDFGKMYNQVHQECIENGIRTVRSIYSLSKKRQPDNAGPNGVERASTTEKEDNRNTLEKYRIQAAADIKKIMKAKSDQFQADIDKQIAAINRLIEALPPQMQTLPSNQQRAIDAAKVEVVEEFKEDTKKSNVGVQVLAESVDVREEAGDALTELTDHSLQKEREKQIAKKMDEYQPTSTLEDDDQMPATDEEDDDE